jgi:hypothetical protein
MENLKNCPYCGEEILATAKKCKHCGEWIKEEGATEDISELTQESTANQPYPNAVWMVWVCYFAMFFSIIDSIHSFGIEKGYGKYVKLFVDIASFIPEYVSTICNTVLWIILFWGLKNYFKQKQNAQSGLFITLMVLEGINGLCPLLIDENNEALAVLFLLCVIAYCVIMFITGIKLSGKLKTAFIVYVVALIPSIVISMTLIEIWGALLAIALDLYLLWSIKSEFEVEMEEGNE